MSTDIYITNEYKLTQYFDGLELALQLTPQNYGYITLSQKEAKELAGVLKGWIKEQG